MGKAMRVLALTSGLCARHCSCPHGSMQPSQRCQVKIASTLFIRVRPSDANPSFLGPTARVLGTPCPWLFGMSCE